MGYVCLGDAQKIVQKIAAIVSCRSNMQKKKGKRIAMAKTNKEAIMRMCKSIEQKEGEGSIYSLGSGKSNLKIPRWSTGIEDLDYIIGGGMPEGRMLEIFGAESSGKTSLGYQLCGQHDLCLYVPAEGTFDPARAKVFGNRSKQMLVYPPKNGDAAMNKILKFAEAGIPLIVLDTVSACKPKEDIDKLKKAIHSDKDETVESRMGGRARLFHKYLPLLEEIIEYTGTTFVMMNQIIDKVDAMMFGEKYETPGGKAPRFYSSIRINVARRAWLEIPNKDVKNSAANEKVGMLMKLKVIKSKVCNPMMESEIPLFFDRGFVSFDDVSSIRKELMKQRGLSAKAIDRAEEEEEDDE
jgi:recombination protein RecA